MQKRSAESGSTTVALAMAVFLILMTVITVYLFVAKVWWFPPAITSFGHEIDDQFARTLLITGIVFVAAQFGLADPHAAPVRRGAIRPGLCCVSLPRSRPESFVL